MEGGSGVKLTEFSTVAGVGREGKSTGYNTVQGRKGGKQVLRMMSRDAVIASFKFCFPIFGFG